MEQTLEKKKGNPNFGKKATQDFNEIEDINKVYQFILCQTIILIHFMVLPFKK